jgi:NADH-quinone oxidoreductase subunit D
MRRESLRTDTSQWVIGPYHPALPGPMRLHLDLDGEVILGARVERGFAHRGLEKSMERRTWLQSLNVAGRLDPEGSVFGELAYVMAVESMSEIEIPLRAQGVRVVISELARISGHLHFVGKLARQAGAETLFHYAFRDREKILDLFELLTGARHSLGFMRFGGVAAEVTDGFIERVLDFCDLIQVRFKEYNDLFSFSQALIGRTASVGVLDPELGRSAGVTGPNLRASGVMLDVRKQVPYCGYQQIDFEVSLGRGEVGVVGDSHDRLIVRIREIASSVRILRQVCESMPGGPHRTGALEPDFSVPPGEGYARIESARGMLSCHTVSEGGKSPARVSFRTPTQSALIVLPKLVEGARLEDLPIILESLDLSIAEADK